MEHILSRNDKIPVINYIPASPSLYEEIVYNFLHIKSGLEFNLGDEIKIIKNIDYKNNIRLATTILNLSSTNTITNAALNSEYKFYYKNEEFMTAKFYSKRVIDKTDMIKHYRLISYYFNDDPTLEIITQNRFSFSPEIYEHAFQYMPFKYMVINMINEMLISKVIQHTELADIIMRKEYLPIPEKNHVPDLYFSEINDYLNNFKKNSVAMIIKE